MNFIKSKKICFLISLDLMTCLFSLFLAMYLRLDFFYPVFLLPPILILVSTLLLVFTFLLFGIYKTINRFSGWDTFVQLGKSLLIYNFIFFVLFTIISIENVPRSIGILHPMILSLMILCSRALIRILLNKKVKGNNLENVLIYGAGEAGRQLAATITFSKKMKLLGFLEDKKDFIGNKINNKLIYNSKELGDLKKKIEIDTVLLAIPSLGNKQKSLIVKNIQKHKLNVKTLPNLLELETSNISLSNLRSLNINELLGRPEVNTSIKNTSDYLYNKTVLITGGGGSIGSELCKQVLEQGPKKIIILDSSEYSLYKISEKLDEIISKEPYVLTDIIPILMSIQDNKALEDLIIKYKPEIIYHAAAYKHVPMVQINPFEGIKNNVIGTLLLADLTIKYNCEKFVLISSDKAVRPTNIMGASKRFAELIVQAFNENSKQTNFTIVRFGNVLASSGSVVPRFRDQIQKGGPLTLTHKDVTRFFMTAEEAIHLIIEAGGMSVGGEVFILKMGKSVKIYDLAKTMILLSGKTIKNKNNIKGDIEIKITGLRQGEKLYEEVLIGNNPIKTKNAMILKANEKFLKKQVLVKKTNQLKKYINENNLDKINTLFYEVISGYNIKNHNKNEKL